MSIRSIRPPSPRAAVLWLLILSSCAAPPPTTNTASSLVSVGPPSGGPAGSVNQADPEQILRGRKLVITRDCGACHGGGSNPEAEGWLAGRSLEEEAEVIGEHRIWPANLTPDVETGLGRMSERQIFNALRFGLRPSETPDVEITSTTPGVGNHPTRPSYLAPVMPWPSWRHMSDDELWAIAAYLKHGVKPVRHATREGTRPPDQWASWFREERIGSYPLATFPTGQEELTERTQRDTERRNDVLRGRQLVTSLGCSDCHGGGSPAGPGWMAGVFESPLVSFVGPFEREFQIGPFRTYPRNLTPDNTTGLGRFSERQIFNSLRFGLRPGETPDVEITSAVPGEGNHPISPKYLAPPMPWPAWRHLEDEELWAIAAYLKDGLKPVRNRVPDSEGPPDFWGSAYTVANIGPMPAAPFPTGNERPQR